MSAVILAALGSHAVPGLDNPEHYKSWQTASNFHLLHAVALLGLAAVYKNSGSRLLLLAALAFVSGIVFFSGSIYLSLMLSIEGASQFAPVGGLLLMVDWLMIIVHSLLPGSR